jgi:hypothetical protein
MNPLLSPCGRFLAQAALRAISATPLRRREPDRIAYPTDLKAGDVIGFSGEGGVGCLINVGTYGIPFWDICHVGVAAHAADGRLLLFESTTLEGCPCEIFGENFNGTQAHTLEKVLQAYDGKAWHYPLYRSLYEDEEKRLTEFLMATLHTPYDMMGAFRSGGAALSWIESRFREEDLHSIFCSEWVAAALAQVGVFQTDDASRWNPNKLLRRLRGKELVRKPRRLR